MTLTHAMPKSYHTVTPALVVRDAEKAIEFYKNAFGAQEQVRIMGPDGAKVMHAELKIGDSIIFLCDEFPDMACRSPESLGGITAMLHLYVPDVDAAVQRAINAGARVKMPAADMFWGDRYGKVADPFGHEWGLAAHQEEVSPEEMRKRAQAFFAGMSTTEP